jgi:hypothetical protein
VTQTEQTVNRLTILLRKRRNQVSEIEDFGSARWAALLTIQHRLRRGFAQFKLCAHFPNGGSKFLNLLLLLGNSRALLLHDLVLV